MKLRQYIRERALAKDFPPLNLKATLSSGVKKKIMREMATKVLKRNVYFDEIPLGDIMDICEKNGVMVVMEDYRRWSGFLAGREGTAYFDLADKNSAKDFHGDTVYTSIFKNARLVMQWYKMPSGKYEITSYVG